jgi:hypothetical protein
MYQTAEIRGKEEKVTWQKLYEADAIKSDEQRSEF